MEGIERLFGVALLYMVATAVAAADAVGLSLPRMDKDPRPAGPFWKAIEHRVDAAEIAAHAALGAMVESTKSMGALSLSLSLSLVAEADRLVCRRRVTGGGVLVADVVETKEKVGSAKKSSFTFKL
jgi:hypothetical protein